MLAGYTMLNLSGLDLNESDPQTIVGSGDKLAAAEALDTPIILCGIVLDGTPVSPAPCIAIGGSLMLGPFALTFDGDAITVTT